jgi:uroporphyrinogen III methyltransferase / synthase
MSAGRDRGRPLSGRRILITRSPDQAPEFAELLREQGAEVVQVPLIRFGPPDSWEVADGALDRLSRFSMILFTSANAVEFFLGRLAERGHDTRSLERLRLAAIGPGTARALEDRHLRPGPIPDRFVAEGLLALLEGESLEGKEILIPRAQEARELLVEELEKRGARVTVAPVYRTARADENRDELISALRRGLDMATFTASSTVRHFMDLLGPDAPGLTRGIRIACIGRITAETARALGLVPDVIPEKSTVLDLTSAIVRYFAAS